MTREQLNTDLLINIAKAINLNNVILASSLPNGDLCKTVAKKIASSTDAFNNLVDKSIELDKGES